MEEIEIHDPVDTIKQLSDVFVVEVPIIVSDTQARDTRYLEIEEE